MTIQKVGYMAIADIDCESRDRLGFGAFEQGIQAGGDGDGEAAQAGRPEVLEQDGLGVFGLHAGVEVRAAAGHDDFQQRRLVAHADAADMLDGDGDASFVERGLEGVVELAAAAGDAAGTQADTDLRLRRGGGGVVLVVGVLGVAGLFASEEILKHGGDGVGGEVAVGDLADLDGRGQRATAEARDFFDGEEPLRVGVVAGGDVQVPQEAVHDGRRALDMAGRADADADDVLAGGAMAELVVERADTLDVGRADRRQLADPLQRLAREVAVVTL